MDTYFTIFHWKTFYFIYSLSLDYGFLYIYDKFDSRKMSTHRIYENIPNIQSVEYFL